MTTPDEETAIIVVGYRDGLRFSLDAMRVERSYLLAKSVVPQARSAFMAGREDGLRIFISSAFRSMEEQQELYRKWKEGVPGFNPADPPGHSKHQQGIALDLHFETAAEREAFAALSLAWGFSRPHHGEPWHFEVTPIANLPDIGPT